MTVSQARLRANKKYAEKAYDSFIVRLKKGKKQQVQVAAAAKDLSTNAYIARLIEEDLTNGAHPESEE